MAEPQFVSQPMAGMPAVGTDTCPRVADLIHYALGQGGSEDRRRIEAHLQQSGCPWCRGWIDGAARHRDESLPANPGLSLGIFAHPPSPPPPVSNPTPIPESAKWQRQAFAELQRRLEMLEETA
jgi:hypothetical protein